MSCLHEKFETLKVHEEYTSCAAWIRKVATVRCNTCEKELRVDYHAGRIEQLKLLHELEHQTKCLHVPFVVDSTTITFQRELERDSDVSYLVLDGSVKHRRFWMAVATCKFCEFKFYVRAFFSEERAGDTLTMKRTTKWRPVKRRFGKEREFKIVPLATLKE